MSTTTEKLGPCIEIKRTTMLSRFDSTCRVLYHDEMRPACDGIKEGDEIIFAVEKDKSKYWNGGGIQTTKTAYHVECGELAESANHGLVLDSIFESDWTTQRERADYTLLDSLTS
mgnify:CR=1 FL=1